MAPNVERDLNDLDVRALESFPEPAFAELVAEAFGDFGLPSRKLADVVASEAARRDQSSKAVDRPSVRFGAYRGERLVGWTHARIEAGHVLHMLNSGVARGERRRGVYSALVKRTIEHATALGLKSITSRHVPANNAVIIAKLRAGFHVSGFEYSEVYGPLVCLTCLVGAERRALHEARSTPIVPAPPAPP